MKKMGRIIIILALLLASCNQKNEPSVKPDVEKPATDPVKPNAPAAQETATRTYSNQRFRNVTVERIADNEIRVKGEGQIFEASFNWIIEDGHNELKKGYQMTDAGAPEWGKFDFTIQMPEKPQNGTLTLMLFETSAMDGSRQHELPIALD
jgi:hypothetical protein